MEETTVPELKVKEEFYRSTEKFHVITCWVGIALNLVWFISDIFVLPEYWLAFFIFRASVSLIATLILISRKITGINIYATMFVLVLGISIQNAYMWSVMDIEHFQQHAFAYMVLFIGVGMLVLWEVIFSVIVLAATIISNIIFYGVNSNLSVQEFVINGGLLILTVAIFCVFLIRTRYRLTYREIKSRLELAKSKEIIEEKHEEVVNQKKEITDSINYARSIQQSLIPLEGHFNSHFKDSFVLFKPKDIVSGDFYWIYEKNNVVFYATGDCTGHGVPGGFMTMLGLSFLDEIVEVKGIKTPSEILNMMRDKIVSTLKQHGNFGESKDGMDITICCFDKNKKELQYASANNALYIVKAQQEGHGQELQIYKADKQPCGFYHVYKPFTNNVIKLEEGDCIYTFSDGFPDQFGGPNFKKYMHRQFKEVLLQNCHLNFTEQKNLLNSSFETWRGKQDQVDDVLVIGVKV
ncbi:MAG: SpoIIE family protein phosphatase [Bacteroidetes bacterium]|nr:SpoIIE family protein phosphatase [Bacteroidota bacterium]